MNKWGFALVLNVLALALSVGTSSAQQEAGIAAQKILFRVKVSDRMMETNALAEGKKLSDFSEITLPGRLYAPPIKATAVKRSSANWDTPVAAATADFSAQKADDADWIAESFVPGDRAEVQSLLGNKGIRARNLELFQKMNARYISGEANYKDYVLLFVRDGDPKAFPKVMALEKTPKGYRRTNALSRDDTFDIVWSALQNGEVKALK